MKHKIINCLHAIGSYSRFGVDKCDIKSKEDLINYFEKINIVNNKLINLLEELFEVMPELDLLKENKQIDIINLKDEKPSKLYDFYIDRRSPVGNPYVMNTESQRDQVCDWYEDYFNHMIELEDQCFMGYLETMKKSLNIYGKLRLFCWCSPKRCHGETIRKYLMDT